MAPLCEYCKFAGPLCGAIDIYCEYCINKLSLTANHIWQAFKTLLVQALSFSEL